MKTKLLSLLLASTFICSCNGGGEVPTSSGSTSEAPTSSGFTVKFDTHGGSLIEDMTSVTLIETSPLTTRENHIFKGWFTTETYENQVSFPYAVSVDQTLHAKWELSIGVEVLSIATSQGTAKAYMQGKYLEDSLEVKINVIDNIIFNSLTDPHGLNGMNDNIELFVTPFGDLPSGLPDGKMYKIMVVPGVGFEVKRFERIELYEKGKVGWWIYSNPLTNQITSTNRLTFETSDGFNGYTTTINIPYSIFEISKDDAVGKMSLFLAMRNSDSNSDTTYGVSSYLGSEHRHAWTYPLLNENNELVQRQVETIVFGDSYTDMDFYRSFNADYEGKHVYSRGISGTKALEWKNQKLANVLGHNPKNVVIHIGVNDIDDGGTSGANCFNRVKLMVDTIHERLPECKINWITVTDNFMFVHKASEYHSLNDLMKAYADENEWLNVIDFASFNNGKRITFIQDGLHLNQHGYNALTKMIYEVLDFDYSQGHFFGYSTLNYTSRGFDISNDESEVVTNGWFDQYAFVRGEGRTSFTFETKLSAIARSHNDPSPKMGLVIKGESKMLYFFIDMYATLTGKVAGYVYLENYGSLNGSDFNWGSAQSQGGLDINYANNNYVTLKIVYNNGTVNLLVNGTSVFSDVVTPFGSEEVFTGLLSFNTAFKAKDYSIN